MAATLELGKSLSLIAGPAAGGAVGLAMHGAGVPAPACWCAAITIWCAIWWIFEAIPHAATALIPFAMFPLAGVLSHAEVATAYGHTLILLMLAGSILSKAMEKSGTHRRIALGMVRLVGGAGDRRIVLGFLLAAAVLSMWISNTATTVMLLPVALAVLEGWPREDRLAPPLLLAITYGAAVGGSATPIGTPPNLIFIENYANATGNEVGFAAWMKLTAPVVVLMLPLVWLWLTRGLKSAHAPGKLADLGEWLPQQKRVLTVLGLTAVAWLTRSAPFGGWSALIGADGYAGDSTVALLAVLVLFVLPAGGGTAERLLDWRTAVSIPWGVFIMIGGGLAIGMAFRASSLNIILGDVLAPLTRMPLLLVLLTLSLFATFFTEITSNTAVANILLPITAAMATASELDPLLIMLPVTIATNFAFMLPVATANNAIVYGSGRVSMQRMLREGFALNLLGVILIGSVYYLLLA